MPARSNPAIELRGLFVAAYGPHGRDPTNRAALGDLVRALVGRASMPIGDALGRLRPRFQRYGGTPRKEQLVGPVFEVLLRNDSALLRRWDGTRGIEPYMAGIVRIVVLDYLRELRGTRDSKFEAEAIAPDELDRLPIHADLEQHLASREELAHLVDTLYATAPERELQVFELHCVLDVPVREVASTLRIDENAASQALRRLRARATSIVERQPRKTPARFAAKASATADDEGGRT